MPAYSQGSVLPIVDLFDAYFNGADLNRDGWISGDEAVAFFRGSNLDTRILSQIWNYANQNGTRFLGRFEFYNFLKLVTIGQTRNELTPAIVKAAFDDPASANIPAPQINLPAIPGPQPNPLTQSGFASGSFFLGDGFSATESQKKDGPGATSSTGSMPVSSGLDLVPVSAAALSSKNQQVTVHYVSSAPGVSPQVAAAQTQQQWPRLTQSNIRKYTEIFLKVDKDKDGKITGEEACNLFLSWKLPREIIEQVWDLSDQDNDSMLSLREFCIAVYLMERDREKCPLPSVLPSHIMYDLPPAVQDGFGHTAWGYNYGPQQPVIPCIGPAFFSDNSTQPIEQKTKVLVLEKHLVDQLSEGQQISLNSKFQEATEANKKVEELEKDIEESRERMEFFRAKMQELVLYKSRCDTRLNETTAQALADKHEVELLAKKYEEKYRQTGDVASRLTIEEARFREIRGRVEQVQSSLEEVVKSLDSLRAKQTLVELPLFFCLLFLTLFLLFLLF